MKQGLYTFFSLFVCMALHSQAPEESKKHLYYHRYASAEAVLHDYLRQTPSDAEAWFLLTKSYFLQKEFQKANDTLSLAPVTLREDPYFLIAKGSVSQVNNKNEGSRSYFDKAINITKGKDAAILAAVAEMEIISKNSDMTYALGVIQKAMKKDKNNASLYILKGNAYRGLHNGGEAFRAYTNAAEKDKGLAEAYYLLGDLFLSQKNAELYLEYFTKAMQADKNYGPAFYELYQYHVYTKPDPGKAMHYFQQYAMLSDKTIKHDYSYTDLLYLTKNYQSAITTAKKLIHTEDNKVQPRIFKLIAYSYTELNDSLNAFEYMRQYFRHEVDSNLIVRDYETMGELYLSRKETDSAVQYFQKAATISNDPVKLYQYYKNLATIAANNKEYAMQAKWMSLFCTGNVDISNVDLFNWGIAAYRANNYLLADSVFGLYTTKYPEQSFGYYWRARSNAVMDTAMTEGLAIPYYNKLIGIANKDSLSTTEKKWMLEAFAYLAAYETNIVKNYEKAIDYFDKILDLDPENINAKKYIPILEASAKKDRESN